MPRRVSRFRRSGPRRMTEWGFLQSLTTTTVGNATKVLLGGLDRTDFGDSYPLTLVRTRGLITLTADQFTTSELQLGALGVLVCTDAAFQAGSASLPGPATNAVDGVWQTFQYLQNQQIVDTAVGFDSAGGVSYEIDSKA